MIIPYNDGNDNTNLQHLFENGYEIFFWNLKLLNCRYKEIVNNQ